MSNGARTIIVESPDRFARDLMVQLAGPRHAKGEGSDAHRGVGAHALRRGHTNCGLARQVLGAIAEFEKTTLVVRLAAARRRKRIATGENVVGRKSYIERARTSSS